MEKSKYEIGVSVGWDIMKNIPVRYVEHEFLAMIGEELVAPPPPLPYAYINVKAPELPDIVTVPVSHKVDFWNLWVLDSEGVLTDEKTELIIRKVSPKGLKRLAGAILPSLDYSVYFNGYLNSLHSDEENREFALGTEPYLRFYGHERS